MRATVVKVTVAALEAAALGSFFGTVVFLGSGAFFDSVPWDLEDVLILPFVILLVSFFALMIVLPATALFGGVSAFVLTRFPRSAAMAAVVTAAGGMAGWAVWALIQGDLPGVGICYGAITGLFWYLRFPRRKVDAKEGRRFQHTALDPDVR